MKPSALKTEAEGVVHGLGLLPLLSEYGEARIVGSVALDLIVKLDVDVAVLAVGRDLFRIVHALNRHLFDRCGIREVRITDHREHGGLKLGIDAYAGRSGVWSVDVWVTDRPETTGFDQTDRWLKQLEPEHREAILAIKRAQHAAGNLKDGLSTRIYDAVLNGGIRTPEAFQAWRDSIEKA